VSVKGSKTLGWDQKFAGEDFFLMNRVAKGLSLYGVVSDIKYCSVLWCLGQQAYVI